MAARFFVWCTGGRNQPPMIRQFVLTAYLVASFFIAETAAQEAPQPKSPSPAKENVPPKAKEPAKGKEPAVPVAGPSQSAPAQAAPAQVPAVVPEPEALLMLIRTTLVALNQANQTGNYTVLRDLGSANFQATNSSAQLAIAFTNLRQQNLDLSPVTVVAPQVTQPPQIRDKGLLEIAGFFPTAPLQIRFQMYFERVGKAWRLYAMSVSAVPPAAAATPP